MSFGGVIVDEDKSLNFCTQINAMDCCRYAEKQVGYMACAILLNEVRGQESVGNMM